MPVPGDSQEPPPGLTPASSVSWSCLNLQVGRVPAWVRPGCRAAKEMSMASWGTRDNGWGLGGWQVLSSCPAPQPGQGSPRSYLGHKWPAGSWGLGRALRTVTAPLRLLSAEPPPAQCPQGQLPMLASGVGIPDFWDRGSLISPHLSPGERHAWEHPRENSHTHVRGHIAKEVEALGG